MIKVSVSDQTKTLREVNPQWIQSIINKNRVMGKQICIEIDINSENVNLVLTTNCGSKTDVTPANEFESRIIFLWNDLVLSKEDIDSAGLYEFLKRIDHWVSFVPK